MQNSSAVMSAPQTQSADTAAFLSACQNGDVQAVEALLLRCPWIAWWCDEGDGVTGLWLAAEGGHTSLVSTVLRSLHGDGALVARVVGQAREPEHVTPLYVAAQNSHTATVATMCRALTSFCPREVQRSLVNAAKTTGATPLYIAAQQGCSAVVRTLLAAGAAADTATSKGLTPLMIAAYQGHADCVAALLRDGKADVTRRTAQCRDALDWARTGAATAAKQERQSGEDGGDARMAHYKEVERMLQESISALPSSSHVVNDTLEANATSEVQPSRLAVAAEPQPSSPGVSETHPAQSEVSLETTSASQLSRDEVAKVNVEWRAFRERILKEAQGAGTPV